MTITVTFDPPLPSDSPAVFNSKAFTLLGDLNDWSTEANTTKDDINADKTALLNAGLATVSANISNVSAVGTNIAKVNAVADDLAEPVSEIATVSDNIANVNTVGSGITNVNTVAGAIANVNTVATNIANVNSAATNMAAIIAAPTQASNAAASATAAANSFDAFDDRYLGSKSSAPTLDNDGNALLTGALYWNTVSNVMQVWSGTAWVTFNPVNNPVDQTDIGTAPNEIPLNQYLGSMAYEDIDNVRVLGQLTVGATTPAGLTQDGIGMESSVAFMPQIVARNKTADTNAAYLVLDKDRAGAVVANGDIIGNIVFRGYGGSAFHQAASIVAAVDGAPGNNDMPGRISVLTTADNQSSPTERVRFKANGSVRFLPMTQPAAAEAGDVYYDSGTNKLRCFNGTIWNDLF